MEKYILRRYFCIYDLLDSLNEVIVAKLNGMLYFYCYLTESVV